MGSFARNTDVYHNQLEHLSLRVSTIRHDHVFYFEIGTNHKISESSETWMCINCTCWRKNMGFQWISWILFGSYLMLSSLKPSVKLISACFGSNCVHEFLMQLGRIKMTLEFDLVLRRVEVNIFVKYWNPWLKPLHWGIPSLVRPIRLAKQCCGSGSQIRSAYARYVFFPKEHNHKLIMTTRKNKNDNDNNHNENNKHDSSNDNSNHNIMITLITPISQ